MRVLVIDAYAAGDPDAALVDAACERLRQGGHAVDLLELRSGGFDRFMSADEHRAYETEAPLLADAAKDSAARVQASEALLFCYPTTLFGVPPILKGWLERVMVMGVAFKLDDARRVRPALHNVRRLGAVTTTAHRRSRIWKARDGGYRTLMRTLRLNCSPMCRTTFIRLACGQATPTQAIAKLSRW